MPFNSSYADFDKQRYFDSRDYFVGLSKLIVKDPLSTHILKTTTPSGKIRFLVADRSVLPDIGDMVLVCTDLGVKVGRLKRFPVAGDNNIWGKIVWLIQEG